MMYLIDSYIFGSNSNFARLFDSSGVSDAVKGVATDSSGNIYVAGTFDGDSLSYISTPLLGTVETLPQITNTGAFLIKFDSSGVYQWCRIIDGSSSDEGLSVGCDSNGDVYLSGSYKGSPSIKNQTGVVLATLPLIIGDTAAFVSKFDTTGTYLYSRLVDSTTGACYMRGVSCDASQNMYVCGNYTTGTIYVRTASSSNSFSNVATLPTRDGGGAGAGASFLCKFNSSGTYQYARVVDSASAGSSYGVVCDASSNVYFSGYHIGTTVNLKASTSSNVVTTIATLPPPIATGQDQAFCVKFNSSGTYLYSRLVASSVNDAIGLTVTCDPLSNVYIGGIYLSTGTGYIRTASNANVYANVAQLPAVSNGAAFVSKFDASGSYQYSRLVDALSSSSAVIDYGYSVTCDTSGNMYLCGVYNGTPANVVTASSTNVYANAASLPPDLGGSGVFVSKFDSSGSYQYSRLVDSTSTSTEEVGNAVACDKSGNMYLGGNYNGSSVYIRSATSSNVYSNIGTLPESSNVTGFVVRFSPTGDYTAPTQAYSTFARIVDGSGSDVGNSVAVDSSGNVYLAGNYAGTPNIKNSSGTTIATLPTASNAAAFVSKFDSNGAYQYSRIADGTGGDSGQSVTRDSSGNMYFAGFYGSGSTIQIRNVDSSNVTSNVATLPASLGGIATFVSKFDSSGTYQYSWIVDGTGNDYGTSVACDSSGNMYFTGFYVTGSIQIRTVNSSNVTSNVATLPAPIGSAAAFVSKFDSSGTYQYSRLVDGTASDQGYAVVCDSSGNMYFSGEYGPGSTIQIRNVDSSNVTSNVATLPVSTGGQAAFLSKFDSSGTYQYSRIVDGAGNDPNYGLTCDSSGNVYFGGYYTSNVTLNVYTASNTNVYSNVATLPPSLTGTTSNVSAFVSKFDSSGTYQYSRLVDTVNTSDVAYALACDSSGNMYLAGNYTTGPAYIRTASNANVYSNVTTLPAVSNAAAFVTKFDSSGNYVLARIVDGTSTTSDVTNGLACDSAGNVYFAGTAGGTPTIEDQLGRTMGTLPAVTSSAAFLIKMNSDGTYVSS